MRARPPMRRVASNLMDARNPAADKAFHRVTKRVFSSLGSQRLS